MPGEILLEETLTPMGISQNAMARAIGVAPSAYWRIARAINEIVLGRRAITPIMSIRFGAFFGQSEGFWHGLQVACDFRALAKKRHQLISSIRPALELARTSGAFPQFSSAPEINHQQRHEKQDRSDPPD